MFFEPDGIYHIYNQGNNRQKIFFCKENYYYFLRKIRIHLLPYADLLAYCLMPNHFHLMVEVKFTAISSDLNRLPPSDPSPVLPPGHLITLNSSLGIMLRSYTRGINKQQLRSGSLFREGTKALCLNKPLKNIPLWYIKEGVTHLHSEFAELSWLSNCLDYIHQNPVAAGIAKKPQDWTFSSIHAYAGNNDNDLVNFERTLFLTGCSTDTSG